MWKKVRIYYPVVAYHILSYLDYNGLPKRTKDSMPPPPMSWFDNLDYASLDISRVCRNMGHRLAMMGYPVGHEEIEEMDVYLEYYRTSLFFPIDMNYFRVLYRTLEEKQVRDPWRILYSHMMVEGYGGETYDYREGHLQRNYLGQRSDHYFHLWTQRNQLTDEPLALVTAWFERMKRPSFRGPVRTRWMNLE
jgi:hypothetical protein